MNITAVLFDLEDTLFDDRACTDAGLTAVAEAHGNAWPPEQRFARHRTIIEELNPLVFSGELDAHGARLARFERLLTEWQVAVPDAEEATRLYRQAYVAAYRECAGALAALTLLRSAGLKIGVLTNYLREVQLEKAARIGLLPLLDTLLCVDDLPAAKPDARAYLGACEALGSVPEQTVMVGDSLKNDVYGALDAGLQAVWYNRWDTESVDVPTVRHLSELPGLLTEGAVY